MSEQRARYEAYRVKRIAERAALQAHRQEVEAHMDPAELAFRLAWRDYRVGNPDLTWTENDTEDLNRPLFITVTPGAYMSPAYVILAISGTPSRGLFVVETGLSDPSYWRVLVLHGDQPQVIDARRPKRGQALWRAIINLIQARGVVPAWKAEMPWQERYPQGDRVDVAGMSRVW